MPSNYPGNAGNASAHGAPTIACPVDGDPRNAASVNTPLEYLADFVAYLQANAALKGAIETAVFNGQAGDQNGAMAMNGAISTRKLLWTIGAGTLTRFYALPDGTLEITVNCYWTGMDWTRDGGGEITGTRFRLATGGIYVEHYIGATWADSAWVTNGNLGIDGWLKFFGTSTNSNPAATVAQTNALVAKNTPKAFGKVSVDNGTPTLNDGFNCSVAADTELLVTFAAAMANADYTVIASMGDTDANTLVRVHVLSASRLAGSFRIDLRNGSNSPFSIAGWTGQIDFIVFGQQDT